jgi:DNA-binding CsgD family transcriptional regulator
MDDLTILSALIGTVYDTILDLSLWPGVLKQISHFIGGCGTALDCMDAVNKTVNVFHQDGGIEQSFIRLYNDKYRVLNPCTIGYFFARVGEPMATADLLPYEEFLRSRHYKEFIAPYELVDCLKTVLDKSATSIASVSVFRHARDGIVDAAARRRMKLLVPHLRRAVLIGKAIEFKTAEAATFADTFDELKAAMLLVTADGRIVHGNRRALALLTAGDPFGVRDGKLTARHPGTDRGLQGVFAAASRGDASLGGNGVALPLTTRDGDHFVAHVLPLTGGARRRAGQVYAAAAAIFVTEATFPTPSPPEVIARTYGLTPTELRVLLAVVEVGGVPEVAETLGIAETTVKTHLSRLFEKTSVRRQADLVKIVAGFANPLAG